MLNKTYTVVVTESVRKLIFKLPASIATKIENNLLKLEVNPRPAGCKKLKGEMLIASG